MSRKKASQHMVVLSYSVTRGLVNNARVGESSPTHRLKLLVVAPILSESG